MKIVNDYQRTELLQYWKDNHPHIYEQVKDNERSWNNFFDCPACKRYRFRVCLNVYLTPYWDTADLNCLCLNCGFRYKKKVDDNYLDDVNCGFDPVDFIADYFKNRKDLKLNDECLEYLVNSMSKYRMTESQATLKDFIKEAK